MKLVQKLASFVFVSAVLGDTLRPSPAGYDAYGLIYFTGEHLPEGEQIYFSVSETNSPSSWIPVNEGRPVLVSTKGTKGLRDPYIIRDPITKKFIVIATDLKMYGGAGGTWEQASRNGSLSLSIWESQDLKKWSPQRLVRVSPPNAGMTWAPETTYDPVTRKFMVYWSSKLFEPTDTSHSGDAYAKTVYSSTTDFRKFSPAKVWFDPGHDVIDTSVSFDAANGYYHRFSTHSGRTWQQRSRSLFGRWENVTFGIGESIFGGVEGPLSFLSNTEANKWHLWLDDLSPRGYVAFETTNITAGNWTQSPGYVLPTNPRHGTVFGITAEEKANLLSIKV